MHKFSYQRIAKVICVGAHVIIATIYAATAVLTLIFHIRE